MALDVLPPLVWTPEYSEAVRGVQVEAVSEQGHRHYSDDHRTQMLHQLGHGPTLRMDLVLGQAVLRRPVGGASAMADQLLQLGSVAQLPGVKVFLAPDRLSAFAGMASFTVLSFCEAQFDDVVYLDSLHGGTWLESEPERRSYVESFERLTSAALPAAVTTGHLYRVAQHLKDTTPTGAKIVS